MNFNYTKLALAVCLSLSPFTAISAENGNKQLETIVITAEKITAESQKTPLSVSVFQCYRITILKELV